MTRKIYLETFKKCPGSLCFPLLRETLKKMVAERIDPLAVELVVKLSYTSCIRAEEAKYHRSCMKRFLSSVMVWCELTSHDTTSLFTLFEVQKYIEDSNNGEMYSIKHLSTKWSERYGAKESKIRLTQREGSP